MGKTATDKIDRAKAEEYVAKEFPSFAVKFLWNNENVYRFRINNYRENEDIISKFVHVVVDKTSIHHSIRDD
jgi:hypothetical protein